MKKKAIITIFFVTLLLIPKSSFAYVWQGGVDGVGGYVSSCSSYNYCYSMVGLRVSLYKMSGNNANKVGRSHDYWKTLDSDGTNQNDPKDHGSGSKDLVSSLHNDDINDKKRNNLIPNAKRFNVSLSNYRKYDSKMVTYLGNQWKYDYRNEESSRFISWMNNKSSNAIFQTLDEYDELEINLDLNTAQKDDIIANNEKYYLVVETLFGIWVGSNSRLPSSGNFETGKNYIGTLYELNAFTTRFGGMQLYAEALISPNSVGNFVGNDSSSIIRTSKPSDSVTQNYIKNNYAIGMAVFKLSDIVLKKTCTNVCKKGNLECAENYCEKNTRSDNEKRNCIVNECEYGEKSKYSCSTSSGLSTGSSCYETKGATAISCLQSDTGNDFYSVSCKENTNVTYSNDLPIVLYPGLSGFNYSATTTGKKICTLDFNYQRFMLEYAAIKRSNSTKRNSLINQLNEFIRINQDYNIDKYKYIFNDDSSNGISLIINDQKIPLTRNLSMSKTSSKYTYTPNKLKKIIMYGEFNISKDNVPTNKTLTTTNSELFELPLKCYSLETGKVVPLSASGTCANEIKNIAYYGYYSLLKDKIVPTKTITIKESSGLEDTNTCKYYNHNNLDDDFNCKLTASQIGSTDNYKVEYHVLNDRNNNSETYMLNGNAYNSVDDVPIIYVSAPNTINASITGKINDTSVTKFCPITIKKTTTPITSLRCLDFFASKSTHYDAIRSFCKTNWKKDGDNYNSFSDCYNSCSSPGRKGGTCKSKYSCEQTTQIEEYCESSFAKDGYKSVSACINDCNCKEVTTEYFYRPISLSTPFPNRLPGSNWIGYVNNISENDFIGKKPEYVIELNKNTINKIKQDTSSKGGIGNTIFKYSGAYNDGFYESDFINTYFTCKRGGC